MNRPEDEMSTDPLAELRGAVQPVVDAMWRWLVCPGSCELGEDEEGEHRHRAQLLGAAMRPVAQARVDALVEATRVGCMNKPPCPLPWDRTDERYPNYPCRLHAMLAAAETQLALLKTG